MRPVLFISALLLLLSSFIYEHKFYMSLTEVHHNTEARSLEISTRFFTDDVERAIANEGEITRIEESMDEELLPLLARFYEQESQLMIDGKAQQLQFLGYEVENEILWCYAEVHDIRKIHALDVSAEWLFDLYRDQVNIINVHIGEVKAAYLNPDEPSHRFELMP